jgi:hypothetical protein
MDDNSSAPRHRIFKDGVIQANGTVKGNREIDV